MLLEAVASSQLAALVCGLGRSRILRVACSSLLGIITLVHDVQELLVGSLDSELILQHCLELLSSCKTLLGSLGRGVVVVGLLEIELTGRDGRAAGLLGGLATSCRAGWAALILGHLVGLEAQVT